MAWLLSRVEQNPRVGFSRAELVGRDAAAFDVLHAGGLLVREQVATLEGTGYFDGRVVRTVVELPDGSLEAFDPDDPDGEWTEVDIDDVARWTVALDVWAQRMAQRHAIAPHVQPITDRILQLGTVDDRVLVVLGMFSSSEQAAVALSALPNLVSRPLSGLIVILPTVTVPPAFERELALRQVVLAAPDEDGFGLRPSMNDCIARLDGRDVSAPAVDLDEAEQREASRSGLKALVPVVITGSLPKARRNEVFINGLRLELQDAEFKQLLRLVIAVHEEVDGWITQHRLKYGDSPDDTLLYFPAQVSQALDRLRSKLQVAYEGIAGKNEFIEADRRGSVRLSTHPKMIRVNVDRLSGHPDELVRIAATRLANCQKRETG